MVLQVGGRENVVENGHAWSDFNLSSIISSFITRKILPRYLRLWRKWNAYLHHRICFHSCWTLKSTNFLQSLNSIYLDSLNCIFWNFSTTKEMIEPTLETFFFQGFFLKSFSKIFWPSESHLVLRNLFLSQEFPSLYQNSMNF